MNNPSPSPPIPEEKKLSLTLSVTPTIKTKIDEFTAALRQSDYTQNFTPGSAVTAMVNALSAAGWVPGQQVLIYENKGLVKKTKA